MASKSVDKAVSISKDNVQAALKAGNVAFSSYEDVLLFSKENVEALVKSSSIFARGFQDISKTFAALAQEQIEESVSVGKALMGAKSFKDVVDLSTSISKSSFDKLVAEGAKLTELSSKLAEEALAPINGRVEAAVGRLTKVAA